MFILSITGGKSQILAFDHQPTVSALATPGFVELRQLSFTSFGSPFLELGGRR